jgi:Helix-turn-helix domain of resolvase
VGEGGGVKMGRKPKLTPHQQAEAIKRRDAGEPMREIGKSFNVSHSTFQGSRPDGCDTYLREFFDGPTN